MLGELAQLSCVHEYEKTYWVMVEGDPTQEKLTQLEHGIQLKDYLTLPVHVRLSADSATCPRGDWADSIGITTNRRMARFNSI